MSLLVLTGASGCLGGMIRDRAIALGLPLILLGRDHARHLSRDAERRAAHDGTATGMAGALLALAPGGLADAVLVHCVAFNSPGDAPGDAERLVDGNIRFGFSALEAVRSAGGRRMVNFGSFWQFDAAGGPHPVNAYAAMKSAFQQILDYMADAHGLKIISLIVSDTYGESDPRPKLLIQLRAATLDRPLTMSDGRQKIAPLHLDDLVGAVFITTRRLAVAGDRDRGWHERFLTAGAEVLSIRDMVAKVETCLGRPVPVLWGARPKLPRIPDEPFTSGARLPGWEPQVSLDEGLQRFFASPLPAGGMGPSEI